MLIRDLATSGAMPALGALMQFAGERQRLIADGIANLDTPDYRMRDLSVRGFREALAGAVDRRRSETGGGRGELSWDDDGETAFAGGELRVRPREGGGGVLFHDRNNRDLERLMQAQAENVSSYRLAVDLLRSRGELLRGAIAMRA